jgi:hypothetical protein
MLLVIVIVLVLLFVGGGGGYYWGRGNESYGPWGGGGIGLGGVMLILLVLWLLGVFH